MKKFIIELGSFSLVLLVLYGALNILVEPRHAENNDYMAAIVDKHERLSAIQQPRIIFAGGSNLAFGLDSKMVEDAFGVSVVNLGLHGGLGLDFILKELEHVIRSGDIVILSIEYYLESKGDYALKQKTAEGFREASKYYRRNLKKDIQRRLNRTRENVRRLRYGDDDSLGDIIYKREYFNEYGDIVIDRVGRSAVKLGGSSKRKYRYWEGISRLNRFWAHANEKKVSVFFIYPCFASSEFEKNRSVMERLNEDIRRDLEIELLGGVRDFVFNDSVFLDTVYHLNAAGRAKRTQRVVELIRGNASAMTEVEVASGFYRGK